MPLPHPQILVVQLIHLITILMNSILSFNSNPQPEANAFLCAYPSQLAKDSIN